MCALPNRRLASNHCSSVDAVLGSSSGEGQLRHIYGAKNGVSIFTLEEGVAQYNVGVIVLGKDESQIILITDWAKRIGYLELLSLQTSEV